MTLYEFVMASQNDYDVYDNEYDAEVTVCYIDKEKDNYDIFCNGIIKKVDIVNVNTQSHSITANWSDLINRNMGKFKAFTAEYWGEQYEDDEDEFIYQWINEIHLYMAGYVDEDTYKELVKLVESLN